MVRTIASAARAPRPVHTAHRHGSRPFLAQIAGSWFRKRIRGTVLYGPWVGPPVYAMFVDDSGNTRPHRAGAGGVSVHILSGLVVHEYGIGGARDAIDDAKRDIFAGSNPRGKELHAYDMWNNRGHFSGAGRGLDLGKKKEAFSRTVGAIAGSGASLASVVVWKNLLHGGFDGPRTRTLAWRLLAERFEAYLAHRGGRDLDLIVSDSSGGQNEAGTRDALAAVNAGIGRRGRYRSRVMEDVIFKDCAESHSYRGPTSPRT